jgi:hypothetical protein
MKKLMRCSLCGKPIDTMECHIWNNSIIKCQDCKHNKVCKPNKQEDNNTKVDYICVDCFGEQWLDTFNHVCPNRWGKTKKSIGEI